VISASASSAISRAFPSAIRRSMGDHHLGLDPAQVEALAARQHRDRHLADLGGGEDELHMRGRFLQRLQQRVERAVDSM
jgi:hypothetical protein